MQFSFIAEIFQITVIFFYSERLVVGTMSEQELRLRYRVSVGMHMNVHCFCIPSPARGATNFDTLV